MSSISCVEIDPSEMGAADISTFLTWLAVERHVSASTQNQALASLLFLYKDVLNVEIGSVPPVVRARTPDRLPVVLSRDEIVAFLKQLTGTERLIVMLLYGSGVRLEECLDLRVKDLDFDRHQIVVRQGKGQKDGCVPDLYGFEWTKGPSFCSVGVPRRRPCTRTCGISSVTRSVPRN